MKRVELAVLVVCLGMLCVLAYSARMAAAKGGVAEADLEQVRGMGNGFTLYYKKYSFFPCLADMAAPEMNSLRVARSKGGCLAMKLLMAGGFVEDARCFFSPRAGMPDDATLDAMQKELDPNKDTTWACTYAYDAGHNPNNGAVPFFGTTKAWLNTHSKEPAFVLTCEQVAKEIDRNEDSKLFTFSNHKVGKTLSIDDDMYSDNTDVFEWRDSWLHWDVPATLAKPEAKAELKPEEKK